MSKSKKAIAATIALLLAAFPDFNWRANAQTITTSSTVTTVPYTGAYSNLSGLNTGANTVLFNADAIQLQNVTDGTKAVGRTGVSVTLDMSTTGANGLDTGAVATGGYNFYVIYNPTTDTNASLAVVAGNTPVMPSGYTFRRRVGWFYYSAGVRGYIQRGNQFGLNSPVAAASGSSGFTTFSLAAIVPPSTASVYGYMVSNNNNVAIGDSLGSIIVQTNSVVSGQVFTPFSFVWNNTALQLSYSSSSAGGSAFITGWTDNL